MDNPLVSVLMPVYNSASTLRRAMDSILNQTYKNIVVVVVEDGCTDNSVAILNDYAARDKRVKVFHNAENLGVARSLNRGIDLCEGKYIARMDADDFSHVERIEKQVTFMETNPDVSILGSYRRIIYSTHSIIERSPCESEEIRAHMLFNINAAHPTIMLRAEPFRQHKDWRYPATPTEDYDLFASLIPKVKFANIPEALLDYYESTKQLTSLNAQTTRASNLKTSRKTIQRELGIETAAMPDGYFGARGHDNIPYELGQHLMGAAQLFCEMENANARLHKFDNECLKNVLGKEWLHIKSRCHLRDVPMTYVGAAGNLSAAIKTVTDAAYPDGNVIVFGTGSYAQDIVPYLIEKDVPLNILAFSDSNPAKHGCDFMGKKIIAPASMSEFDFDYVMIAAPIYEDEIRENLLSRWNIHESKIRSLTSVVDILFHRERREFERQCVCGSDTRKAFLFVAPDYGNLGDHAIAQSEHTFFADRLGMELVEIPTNRYKEFAEVARHSIKPGNLVLITGGGFLGSLWPNTEQMSRQVVEQYPDNPIVILPQTLYWEKSKHADAEAKRTREVYEAHKNLTICARDHKSFSLVREYYPNCRVILVPDMVLSRYWDEFFALNSVRSGAVLCLKQDRESILECDDKTRLCYIGETLCGGSSITDTYRKEPIRLPKRLSLLREKLNEFRSASLCITDRLHGVIFSAITSTPCVALSNCNHKLRESTKLIEYLPYVRFAESIDEVELLAREVMSFENPQFDNSYLAKFFAELETLLHEITEKGRNT
jgi:pyruvyl transferase EpsI